MTNDIKKSLIQLIIVVAIWVPYLLFIGTTTLISETFGLRLIPIVGLLSGAIACFWVKLFAMGLKDMRQSSFVFRLLPLVYVLLLCFGVTLMQQTLVTALFSSMFLGVASAYLGRLLFSK